jgi:hypothetical protein
MLIRNFPDAPMYRRHILEVFKIKINKLSRMQFSGMGNFKISLNPIVQQQLSVGIIRN